MGSERKMLTLEELYDAIEERFPYFKSYKPYRVSSANRGRGEAGMTLGSYTNVTDGHPRPRVFHVEISCSSY